MGRWTTGAPHAVLSPVAFGLRDVRSSAFPRWFSGLFWCGAGHQASSGGGEVRAGVARGRKGRDVNKTGRVPPIIVYFMIIVPEYIPVHGTAWRFLGLCFSVAASSCVVQTFFARWRRPQTAHGGRTSTNIIRVSL